MERSGYGYVMKSTMLRDDLGATAKALYAFLCVHADANGECFPSVKSICYYLRIKEDSFKKYKDQLITAGVVTVTKRRNGAQFANNVYRLVDRPYSEKSSMGNKPCPEKSGTGNNPTPENPRSGERDTNITSSQENHSYNKTTENIYMRLLSLLNEAKSNAFSKGRLKLGQRAKWVVDGLLEKGYSEAELIQRAQELAKRGSKNLDWYDFEDYCKQNHRR